MRGDRRHRRTFIALTLLIVTVSYLASCESVARFGEYLREDFVSSPEPTALDGEGVTLVVLPHSQVEPAVYYTSRETLSV